MVQMPLTKEHCWNCPLSLMVTHTSHLWAAPDINLFLFSLS